MKNKKTEPAGQQEVGPAETVDTIVTEVFTQEQLEILPQETKNDIVFLTDNLPSKELAVLNPLVASLIKIKELEKIKYDNTDEAEKVVSIALYQVARKDITTFNKAVKETKSELKRPIDELGKKILAIEKSLLAISDDVVKTLEKEFEEFEKAERERKDAAAAKRNQKANAAVEQLSAQAQESSNQITKTNFLNKVKYNVLEPWEAKVNEAVDNYSPEALLGLKNDLAIITATDMDAEAMQLISIEILTQDEYNAAFDIYQNKLTGLQKRIDDKIELHSTREENKTIQAEGKGAQEAINTLAGYGIGGNTAAVPVQASPEEPVLREFENLAFNNLMEFIPVIFFKDSTIIDVVSQKADMVARLSQMKYEYTQIFDKAKATVNTEEQIEALKKISGACVLFGKIIDYLNGVPAAPAQLQNNNQQ